jgi:hypothetical protein
MPFSDVLRLAVEKQRVPLFLFLLAYAIIVVGAAVFGVEILRVLVIPLGIALVLGVGAWLALEITRLRNRPGARMPGDVRGGRVEIADGARIDEVKGGGGAARAATADGTVQGGDLVIGRARVTNSRISGGDATVGPPESESRSERG